MKLNRMQIGVLCFGLGLSVGFSVAQIARHFDERDRQETMRQRQTEFDNLEKQVKELEQRLGGKSQPH